MKYTLEILVLLLIFNACKSVKNTTSNVVPTQIVSTDLNSVDQRKFDYFFYEAERLKMQGQLDKAKMYLIECLKIDSLSSTCYYELSNIEIAYKNYEGSQTLLKNAVRLSPENKWYKMLLGDLYQQNNDIKGSIGIYESLVNQFPSNEEYLYVLAQLYTQNKQFQESINTYNLLEKNIGINEIISLEKEKLYLQLGKSSNAYKEIQELIKDNPYEPKYYGYLGDVYFYNKEYDKAISAYNEIFKIDPDNGLGYFSLGNVAINQKDTVSFITNYTKGLLDKDLDIEIKIQRLLPFIVGDDFKNYEDTSSVENLFLTLIDAHRDNSKGYIFYANYLQNHDRVNAAITNYKKGISIDNSNASVWQDLFFLELNSSDYDLLFKDTKDAIAILPEEPVLYLFHGMACMQKELYDQAYQSLTKGFDYIGTNTQLKGQYYAYLGDILYNLKRYDESFSNYDNALKFNENNVVVLNNYSYYLSLLNRDLDKAETMISKCIELEPLNSTYLDTYAWVLFKRERYFEAKYIIERAMDNGGDTSDVIVEHYGDILFKNGDTEGALIQWKKSISLGNKSKVLEKKVEEGIYVEE